MQSFLKYSSKNKVFDAFCLFVIVGAFHILPKMKTGGNGTLLGRKRIDPVINKKGGLLHLGIDNLF